MTSFNRRTFIKNSAITGIGVGLSLPGKSKTSYPLNTPLFKISLAEWSVNKLLFGGKLDHLDFARETRKRGIEAVEYVNQFFMDKATDQSYLKEMKTRADGEGVNSLLIMCDREGMLGNPDKQARQKTVENHKKWADAAKYLGCHSIRVNGYSRDADGKNINFYESMKLVADGLNQLCNYADPLGLNVIIENHGGHSSFAPWLMGVMKMADHPRVGTLPDFGNFRIQSNKETGETYSYDAYRGIKEMMPLAEGVSVKIKVWDDLGQQSDLDYKKMMRIVLDAGYRGYCGIEHGEKGREWESIVEVKRKLEVTRNWLNSEYKS